MPFSLSASIRRWNPSVSSRSASGELALTVCTAASAMGVLPEPFLPSLCPFPSIQIIGVLGDMLGKAERMIAHQGLGAQRVAPFQRFDDVHVIADRAVGPVLLADGLAADHPHMGEQVLGELDQRLVAAQSDDALVKLDIELRIFVEMGAHRAVLE